MYLLINSDNSINYGDNHPVREDLHMGGLRLVEFLEKELHEVVGDILPEEAYWDSEREVVIRNPRLEKEEELRELKWRDSELSKVLLELDKYDRDKNIPEEYRVSSLGEESYLKLLKYRKILFEYPDSENFRLKIRPQME